MALFLPTERKQSLVGTAESRAGSCITDFDINTLSPALNDWEGPDQTFLEKNLRHFSRWAWEGSWSVWTLRSSQM